MWIFIAIVIGVVLFIYSDKKNSRILDEKTLMPMNQWFIIAASASKRQQRLMSISVLHQASNLLDKLGFLSESDFKKLTKVTGFNAANFVFSLIDEANKINSDPNTNNVDLHLTEIWHTEQARVYMMNAVVVILTKKTAIYPGIHQLALLARSSPAPQRSWSE
ncbi:hypothetical protein [Acinetobacter sp. ULE_I037]|uniref:hypothetical protein n=2 Tax=Acinetobacter TaxID=469 RepID=UPI003AF7196E